jgi:23S rRNA pseudouridine2605 synthase
MKVRLQKFLAESGLASRRACEKIILERRVAVNGHVVSELGTKVDSDDDRVTFDGNPVRPRKKLYVALNKPPGYVSSRKDDLGRRTLADLLPREWTMLYSVGRLDYHSEGLILLTNDGDFSLKVSHPRYTIVKTYRATVECQVLPRVLRRFTEGIEDAGEKLQAKAARLISSNNSRSIVELDLAEGKNREVRRLFESQGLEVSRLQRIKIGPIRLGELPIGKWRTLTEPEIKSLLPKL